MAFEFWSVEFYNFNLLFGSSHNNSCWICTQTLIADAKNPIRTFIRNSRLLGLGLALAFELCLFIAHGFRLNWCWIRIFAYCHPCCWKLMFERSNYAMALWILNEWENTIYVADFSWRFCQFQTLNNYLSRICKKNNQHHKAFHNNVLVLGTPMLIEDTQIELCAKDRWTLRNFEIFFAISGLE